MVKGMHLLEYGHCVVEVERGKEMVIAIRRGDGFPCFCNLSKRGSEIP